MIYCNSDDGNVGDDSFDDIGNDEDRNYVDDGDGGYDVS